MKKKYTLTIADIPLNVTVDESPETVEYIVGVIDRKMREILLRSKYCPKTQAAVAMAAEIRRKTNRRMKPLNLRSSKRRR